MLFRAFQISSHKCDKQRSPCACTCVGILVVLKEKLCGKPFFQWCLSAKLASLLGAVGARWSILSAQSQGGWKSSLCCSLKCLEGRCKCWVSPSFYMSSIPVVLCIILLLLSKEIPLRTVVMVCCVNSGLILPCNSYQLDTLHVYPLVLTECEMWSWFLHFCGFHILSLFLLMF